MQEITAPLANLPHDPVPEVANVEFPIAIRGYDRLAVDAYVRRVSQLVAELNAGRSAQHAVRRALERVGEEVAGILQRAHDTAEQVTSQSRAEAEDRIQAARSEAEALLAGARQEADTLMGGARGEADSLVVDAQRRLTELDAETDRIWEERHRIVEDARALAAQLLTIAETAVERFPAAEDAPEVGDTGDEPAAHSPPETQEDPPTDPSLRPPPREPPHHQAAEPPTGQDTLLIERVEPFDHEAG